MLRGKMARVTWAVSIKTKLDVTNSVKHSSLLWFIFNYGHKIFHTIDALVEKDKGSLWPPSKY
jgi:hypothetical protein